MSDYAKLEVWKKAHALTLRLYKATERFPRTELFTLTSQIRRAASSIGANLAEGCGRAGDGDLHRYISIAIGSSSELDYHLLLARDLGYLTVPIAAELREEYGEVSRMLKGLLQAVKSRLNAQRKVVRSKA
jgi:four helix bundle protein